MPTYELPLLIRVLPKVETATVLKRAANYIFEQGGVVRKLENLGTRPTPFKISAHGSVHKEASAFVYKFDFPPAKLETLNNMLGRDVDIIRRRIYSFKPEEKIECTLEEEIQPAPYRKEVQEMIAEGKRKAARKKAYTFGADSTTYPFQR